MAFVFFLFQFLLLTCCSDALSWLKVGGERHARPGVRFYPERRTTRRFLLASGRDDGHDDEYEFQATSWDGMPNNNQTLVTREMFQRHLLQDPVVVKRKSGGGNKSNNNNNNKGYKILDNRDSLPFRVEHVTPDPYTHPEIKRMKVKKAAPRRPGSSIEEGLLSSIFDVGAAARNSNQDDKGKTMVGEFILDKHTTTGDLLEIGDVQYKVS